LKSLMISKNAFEKMKKSVDRWKQLW